MSCIHYKFKSNLDYSTLTFDGLHITLGDLKKLIIQKQKLGKSPDFDLQVTNAQTKEVYKSDDELIPKNASVIVSRAPLGASSKALGTASEASASPSQGEATASVANRISFEKLSQTPDLVNATASEDDKIRAMIVQSTQDYDQSNYVKSKYPTGRPHAGYVCHKCGQTGHFVATCPNKGLENDMPRIKRSTGIPQSFMKVVDNPNMPGAMVTSDGHFVVPLIDAEAYRVGKKEKPPFLESDKADPVEEEKNIPGELLCSLCKDILKDAVVIQCCGNSFCDECVREKLLESEDHMCPQCKETGVSPDSLIPNTYLRKLVINFENETGYIKPARRGVGAGGDAFMASSQNQVPSRSMASDAYKMQQHNATSRPSPTSRYSGAMNSSPAAASQPPQLPSQQLPTSIPASLIGLPPHVIKAHLREMEKARQSANQQAQQNQQAHQNQQTQHSQQAPQNQQQYASAAPSTNSYQQSTHRMADGYPGHQSQSGMMMSQRQSLPPVLSSSIPVSRSMTPAPQTPTTPTMDENRSVGPMFPMINANGGISSAAVNTALNLMSVAGQVMAPTHMASAMTSNLGQAVAALPNQPQSSIIRPGQVPYMAPTSATAAIPRPYMAPPPAQLPPAGSVHPGASLSQTHGSQAGYLGVQSPWQPGQPRPGYQGQVPPGGYPPHSGMPTGGMPLQGIQPRPGMPPHPPLRPQGMVGGPGYRGPVPPGLANGPMVGPLGATRFMSNRPRPMTEEEFYREKERLLREQEKARRDRDRERDRLRLEEERLRMIEREKKRERDLDSMAQEFIDAKRSRKRTRSRSWTRSLSRSVSRSRSRSHFSRGRSRNKVLKGKSSSRSPRRRSHSRSLRPRSSRSRTPRSRSPRPRSPRPRSPRPVSPRSPRQHSPRSPRLHSPRSSSRAHSPRSPRLPSPRMVRPHSSRSPRPHSPRSPILHSPRSARPCSPRAHSPRLSRVLSPRSPRNHGSRSSRLRSPRMRSPRLHSPGSRSPKPYPDRSLSPRPHSSRPLKSPKPHSPYSRSRSFSPSPHRNSYSRSWSRTPERHRVGWSPRRSRSPVHRSWSRTPPPYHPRQRSRSPGRYRHGRRESPVPPKRTDYLYGHHRSPVRDRYPPTYGSPSRALDCYRNPEQYDPRWIEYYRHYFEWYERYGEQYGYPPVPVGMHRERSPGIYSSRTHRHKSRSPSHLWPKEDVKKVKDKRSERGSSREAKEYSRKRKLKSSRESTAKEFSDTEEKVRKSRSKKKRPSAERQTGKEHTSRGSHESDTSVSRKHHSKDVKTKSDLKREYRSVAEDHSQKNNRQGRGSVGTGEDTSDTEHIKTLSVKRETNFVPTDEPYARKRDLIQIATESFEDTKVEDPPLASSSITKHHEEKVQPDFVNEEKAESSSEKLLEPKATQKLEKVSESSVEPAVETKTEVKSKAELKRETKPFVNKEQEVPVACKVENSSTVTKKVKDDIKLKTKKLKDREKSEKLEKIESLQAEIRRLERQQEESLMVAPPELSRWEREDSGQESDSKEHQKMRISSSISKPSLPKHVLESAEKAITQKPRGVVSVASAVSTVSSKSSGTASRRVVVEKNRGLERVREKSPTISVDGRDARARKVLSDDRHMQVTISAVTDAKTKHPGVKEKEEKTPFSKKEREWDIEKKISDSKKDSDHEREKSRKIRLQRETSREMLPPKSTKTLVSSDSRDLKGLERKLSVLDESSFEPDYEEELNEEGLGSSNDTESTITDRENVGLSPVKKSSNKDVKIVEKPHTSCSPSTSPTSDREQKHKHKKKKHKHKHKKHKKQKSVDKEK